MRHHYAPELYFQPWVDQLDARVHTFGVINRRFISNRAVCSSFGYEDDMLRVPAATRTDEQFIETIHYKMIDNEAARVHQKIIRHPTHELSRNDAMAWSQFVLSLVLRRPQTVKSAKQQFEKTLDEKLAQREHERRFELRRGAVPLRKWAKENRPGLIESFGVRGPAELALDLRLVGAIADAHRTVICTAPADGRILTSTKPVCGTLLSGNFPIGQWMLLMPIGPSMAQLIWRKPYDPVPLLSKSKADFVRYINRRTVTLTDIITPRDRIVDVGDEAVDFVRSKFAERKLI
ncbi:MAG: DUF4238 domain-containing protein [Aliihoeflea sp.]|uniref:DUF4238 domain-containing protein n=1 Tax=Aliihoeflea sp. TaxID=2608088 RepID=UPI004034AA7D